MCLPAFCAGVVLVEAMVLSVLVAGAIRVVHPKRPEGDPDAFRSARGGPEGRGASLAVRAWQCEAEPAGPVGSGQWAVG